MSEPTDQADQTTADQVVQKLTAMRGWSINNAAAFVADMQPETLAAAAAATTGAEMEAAVGAAETDYAAKQRNQRK